MVIPGWIEISASANAWHPTQIITIIVSICTLDVYALAKHHVLLFAQPPLMEKFAPQLLYVRVVGNVGGSLSRRFLTGRKREFPKNLPPTKVS
ncbi:hypothetical protein M427DRAFT_56869 [Gonapodya prolifera JEL478]|uniref:Uncharacterized protein n=1 Tax=Gonapodya prolifera (strain JEL478) TaxID=1344416 RepID=A0A139AEL6_GONPJ|nr:hypothetical protein M427DRAFT_56869 [Gonapodya prolifera JEL478]|eukprot:KXS15241.1 hypothetical protein M427DRAFT_56869 [Gonapodya prolifera JEL478]